jgi:hypothetical protein
MASSDPARSAFSHDEDTNKIRQQVHECMNKLKSLRKNASDWLDIEAGQPVTYPVDIGELEQIVAEMRKLNLEYKTHQAALQMRLGRIAATQAGGYGSGQWVSKPPAALFK